MSYMVIHVKAPNDSNGNPKRLYLVLENGVVMGAVNEGYDGAHALDVYKDGPKMRAEIATYINVQANEHKRLMREHGPESKRFRLVRK